MVGYLVLPSTAGADCVFSKPFREEHLTKLMLFLEQVITNQSMNTYKKYMNTAIIICDPPPLPVINSSNTMID